MQSPKKISLATQAAAILKQQILEGQFAHILPGETPLAAGLRVSRKTVREALTILENENFISAAEPGKRRTITLSKSHQLKPTTDLNLIRILLPQPLKEMHASAQHLFTSLIQHLPVDEENIHFHSLPYTSSESDIRPRIHQLVTSHPATLWIVYELSSEVDEVMNEQQQHVIACGGNTASNYPIVAYDSASAITHALHKLIQHGHSRIVRPQTLATQSTKHIEEVLHSAGIPTQKDFNFPNYQGSTKSLYKILSTLFLQPSPPTAFITSGPRELISIITWLASKKMTVPHDVSILHIGSDPLLSAIFPKISYYSTSGEPLIKEIARLAQLLIENPNKQLTHKFFFMDYEAGDSLTHIQN